jgi:hypothetical protein
MRMRFHDRPMPMYCNDVLAKEIPKPKSSLTIAALEKIVDAIPPRTLREANEREFSKLRDLNETNRSFWKR